MNSGTFAGLAAIGVIFGILGAIAVFINSYEGYSHFPNIPKKKRIIMSFEYAFIAFILAILTVFIIILFFI